MATIPLELDGYTDLPPGRIANVVTYLEMLTPPPQGGAADETLSIRRIAEPKPDWYRDLYRRIGERWLWSSRLTVSDSALAAWLADDAVEILALCRGDAAIGLAELDLSIQGEVEIVTFGVVPEETGSGAARTFMNEVLRQAWKPGVARLWLHTCSFDHPAAIPFYRRAGFRPFKFAIEVLLDPRLSGHLPSEAAPHIPLIKPRNS